MEETIYKRPLAITILTFFPQVHSCGWGADGQTGQGHYDNTGKLVKLAGDIQGERVVKLACAADCVLALSDSGEVFGWGNRWRSLLYLEQQQYTSSISLTALIPICSRSEYGQLRSVTSEQQVAVPTRLPLHDVGRVTDIASSGTQCLLVNAEGQVWVWGFGILGLGPKLESSARPLPIPAPIFGQGVFGGAGKVERVFAGLGHLAAVTDQGDLFLWGKNRKSCLGLHTEDDRYFPLKVPIGGKVKQLSLGCDHSVAIVRPWMG